MALVIVLGGLVVWRGRALVDGRAYPGSSLFRSLEGTADKFHITLPDCPVENLHYYYYDAVIGGTAFLTFTADETCVRSFLERNDLRGGSPGPADRIPLAHDPDVRKWGWPLTPDRTVVTYLGHPKPDADFRVSVETEGTKQTVYSTVFEY
ncbi:hypothetical protein ACNTMW_21375 [Planosporangium sp. 12N6]